MSRRKRTVTNTNDGIAGQLIRSKISRSNVSRQNELSDGVSDSLASLIVSPPYDMAYLQKISESSNILGACIDCMTVNISGYGYKIVPYDEDVAMDSVEEKTLESFIKAANTEQSLRTVSSLRLRDKENYGFCFLEVIRDRRSRISLLRHVKSFYLRLLKYDKEEVKVVTEVNRGGRRSNITEFKKFRRFVQNMGTGSAVYFKEFGDPRRMSYRTGRFQSSDYKVSNDDLATEILHEKLISEDPYGIPRWISHLPSMLGSRSSEELNMDYFNNNTVPPMAMLVGGGRLTKSSFQSLTKMLNGMGVGKDRQNQILLIEAIPETTGLDDKGSLNIKIEKLSDTRPSDGLFAEYDEANRSKIRMSFRIPPILLGDTGNQNFASATAGIAVAESQVFVPARMTQDEFLNQRMINHPKGMNLRTVKLESNSPVVTTPDQVVKTATAASVMGALTPRKAIDAVNDAMQIKIPQYPERGEEFYEEWMDRPMQIGMKMLVEQGRTQQTGDTDTPDDLQSMKGPKIKETEGTGETGLVSQAVEPGHEGDFLSGNN